jgi:glucose/arabinose dehydrogenase
MKKNIIFPVLLTTAFLISIFSFTEISCTNENNSDSTVGAENAGLILPSGFSASIVANNLGTVRHIAVTKEGNVYAKLGRAKAGNGILYLKNNNGQLEKQNGFGDYGGTAMRIHDGYLYASSNTDVYRYKLNDKDEVTDASNPEKIVTGLLDHGEHNSKSVTFDEAGNIYVNIGAYSNSCQVEDRTPGSMGRPGCPILDSAGGIWQFKADKTDQHYGDGVHYAMGLRNVVGLDWNKMDNALFVMQHGRDQLHDLFPQYYTTKESAILPAECMYEIHQGDNAGWPYIYYDQIQKKQILMPEYGGDGKKTADKKYLDPAMAFPGHLAPNDLLFYTGAQFPEKYKNGAFIAFHGSWNRSPEPQAGYFVVFVPFENGKPAGNWEVFADGFAGAKDISSPGKAEHRPCGLAQGPDGSLYVSDDVKGNIYKIVYHKK